MSPERQQRLESLADWSWDVREQRWPDGLAKLEQFIAREGHSRVPAGHIEGGFRLGQWVANRRADQSRLSVERQATLDSLPGWTWAIKEARWEEAYDRLRAYAERVGHGRVPASYTEDGLPLGRWVSMQRARYREGRMTATRARRLEAVPGWTWRMFRRRG